MENPNAITINLLTDEYPDVDAESNLKYSGLATETWLSNYSREREREGRERPESRKDTGGLNCLLSKGYQIGRLMQTALKLPCNRSSKIALYRLWEGQFLSPKKIGQQLLICYWVFLPASLEI